MDSNQPSSLHINQDSGVSTSQPPSLTVSLIAAPPGHQNNHNQHADVSNQHGDISQNQHADAARNQRQNGGEIVDVAMAAQQVLISYAADAESNDISVGFPLGSSTPTRK
eukprot:TRINITY_DN7490_c1_g1_i1.p1 TRINITY_DN7490_c1_g1~~TRINITY_DN7490_c1_g1_i1.p1  ORF type:complete len:110 (+),score=26.01 TRINITY_DN7490_c1_g1_i1:1-330(+)